MTYADGAIRIYIKLQRYTKRGPVYEARLGSPDGPVIVEASTEPIFPAARELRTRGMTGCLEMWDEVRPYPRMSGDIAKLATLTVREDDEGLRLRRWKPFPAGTYGPKQGVEGSEVGEVPPKPGEDVWQYRAGRLPDSMTRLYRGRRLSDGRYHLASQLE